MRQHLTGWLVVIVIILLIGWLSSILTATPLT